MKSNWGHEREKETDSISRESGREREEDFVCDETNGTKLVRWGK